MHKVLLQIAQSGRVLLRFHGILFVFPPYRRIAMFIRLFLAFSIVPLIELYILLKVGSLIGPLPTIAIVIATASGGAYLAKRQGFSTIMRIRELLSSGVVPGDEIIDGILIFIAALLLLTPGLLTDAAGLLLLIPPSRRYVREIVKRNISTRFSRRW